MDQSKHDSLRQSVFELVNDLGLDTVAFEGKFTSITEEDETDPQEHLPSPKHGFTPSEESSTHYPLTPPQSALRDSPNVVQPHIHFEERPEFNPSFSDSHSLPFGMMQFGGPSPDASKLVSPPSRPRTPGKLRKVPHLDQLVTEPEPEKDKKQGKKAKRERERLEKEREKERERLEKERGKQEKLAAKERGRDKKAKDAPERGRASPSPEDEEKKKGFIRFRLKSRERKAAENDAPPVTAHAAPAMPTSSRDMPILPIAGKFARGTEDVAFRDSQSTNGNSTDGHDAAPRRRERGSRYERPHPAWRTAPSSLTSIPSTRSPGSTKEEELPVEIHALPPGQTPADRIPMPSQLPIEEEEPTEVEQAVDPEVIRQYYGLEPDIPAPTEPQPMAPKSSPTFAQLTPNAQKSLQQALRLTTTDLSPRSPSPQPSPSKTGRSPFIVPSPGPSQQNFSLPSPSKQPITPAASKRAGVQFVAPPPLNTDLTPPRRANDPNNPPPTPPPTTGLPPTPPGAQTVFLSPNPTALLPSPRYTPRSGSPYGRAGATLSPRAPSPNARAASPINRPSSPLRPPGTVASNGLKRGASQRGKASPFPTKPITKPNGAGSYLLNRRVDASNHGKITFAEPSRQIFDSRNSEDHDIDTIARVHAGLEEQQYSSLAPPSRRDTRRSRDTLRGSTHAGGYESDGDAESRYSRDTYYGRNTLYDRDGEDGFAFFDEKEKEEALSHMPMSANGKMQYGREVGLSDIEQEREAGRDRLVRLLVARGEKDDRI